MHAHMNYMNYLKAQDECTRSRHLKMANKLRAHVLHSFSGTSLHAICEHACVEHARCDMEIIKILLDNGMDVSIINDENKRGLDLLSDGVIAEFDSIEPAFATRLREERGKCDGNTPLHNICGSKMKDERHRLRKIRELLSISVDTEVLNNYGKRAFDLLPGEAYDAYTLESVDEIYPALRNHMNTADMTTVVFKCDDGVGNISPRTGERFVNIQCSKGNAIMHKVFESATLSTIKNRLRLIHALLISYPDLDMLNQDGMKPFDLLSQDVVDHLKTINHHKIHDHLLRYLDEKTVLPENCTNPRGDPNLARLIYRKQIAQLFPKK